MAGGAVFERGDKALADDRGARLLAAQKASRIIEFALEKIALDRQFARLPRFVGGAQKALPTIAFDFKIVDAGAQQIDRGARGIEQNPRGAARGGRAARRDARQIVRRVAVDELAAVAPRRAPADLPRFEQNRFAPAPRRFERARKPAKSAADNGDIGARLAAQRRRRRRAERARFVMRINKIGHGVGKDGRKAAAKSALSRKKAPILARRLRHRSGGDCRSGNAVDRSPRAAAVDKIAQARRFAVAQNANIEQAPGAVETGEEFDLAAVAVGGDFENEEFDRAVAPPRINGARSQRAQSGGVGGGKRAQIDARRDRIKIRAAGRRLDLGDCEGALILLDRVAREMAQREQNGDRRRRRDAQNQGGAHRRAQPPRARRRRDR